MVNTEASGDLAASHPWVAEKHINANASHSYAKRVTDATEQSQLIAAGKQTPEQAQAMVRALADLNKTQPPKPSALQDFLQSFPAVAILGAALAGALGGFAPSRLLSGAFRLPVSARG
jgi:hypothetical protein